MAYGAGGDAMSSGETIHMTGEYVGDFHISFERDIDPMTTST